MTDYVGLTWDHPRGRNALEVAAGRVGGGDTLRWEVQPLEGFESAPIAELAGRYDLLVLDHPHLGDAIAADCLRAIDGLFDADQVRDWERAAVGPSVGSYRVSGRLWALPLDAATQVAARRRDLVPQAPTSWDEAIALAQSGVVATSLAGPHAFLSWCSIAMSLDGEDGTVPFGPGAALRALEILRRLSAHAPAGTAELNPIGLLDRMRDAGDIGYLPLVYGYVGYSSAVIAFGPPPTEREGRIGSTLGGTGIAVTRRSEPSRALLDHLRWLLEERTQRELIPAHDGQPSARAAWTDPRVDEAAHGFYSATLPVIEAAWVRPRMPGFVPFQAAASELVRSAVVGSRRPQEVLDELEERYNALREEDT